MLFVVIIFNNNILKVANRIFQIRISSLYKRKRFKVFFISCEKKVKLSQSFYQIQILFFFFCESLKDFASQPFGKGNKKTLVKSWNSDLWEWETFNVQLRVIGLGYFKICDKLFYGFVEFKFICRIITESATIVLDFDNYFLWTSFIYS